MSDYILEGEGIHKIFHDPHELCVLKGASLKVKKGESVAIIGKSGEGKSTLLHILGTLESPSQGKVIINGQEVDYAKAAALRNKHIGFVFQSFNLLEEDTLLENILMPAKIGRTLTPEIRKRAHALLEEVGLLDRKDFLAKRLSGGEKQRAAIARALLNDPDLILADEPTGNLDQASSQKIHELLLKASRDYNKSVIIVTHDKELSALCDRSLIMKEGKLHAWNS